MARKAYFDFLDLPPELREFVYTFTFDTCLASAVEKLSHPRGPNSALLATCKLIHSEGGPTYARAAKLHRVRRKALLDRIARELLLLPSLRSSYDNRQVSLGIKFKRQIERSVGFELQDRRDRGHYYVSCRHARKYTASFTEACNECQKMYSLAAWYTLHPDQAPRLLKRDGTARLTAFGDKAKRYTWSHLGRPYPSWKRFQSPRVFGQHWWAHELDRQRHVEKRCQVRKQAVEEYWRARGERPVVWRCVNEGIDEQTLSVIEKRIAGEEVKSFEEFSKEWVHGGVEWRGEYRRQAKEWEAAARAMVRCDRRSCYLQSSDQRAGLQDTAAAE